MAIQSANRCPSEAEAQPVSPKLRTARGSGGGYGVNHAQGNRVDTGGPEDAAWRHRERPDELFPSP